MQIFMCFSLIFIRYTPHTHTTPTHHTTLVVAIEAKDPRTEAFHRMSHPGLNAIHPHTSDFFD
jgi:hypothetical protein